MKMLIIHAISLLLEYWGIPAISMLSATKVNNILIIGKKKY